jgi:2-C-methyl-D-erythritol 4-phosphate cytidylyltransferase / 2-C-methyl-D-erythritol 2,4-cyclodiphosphate synthase
VTAAALIVAAGRGTRFGAEVPKVFVDLAGAPLYAWALRTYDACPEIGQIVLAVSPDYLAAAEAQCRELGLTTPLRVIAGGAARPDTVWAGLLALRESPPNLIAVQDGARPLTRPETIRRSLEIAAAHGASVTAAPVTDTIKEAGPDHRVVATPDRIRLWAAQTPQTFRYDLLLSCYRQARAAGWETTDDASVVERCGYPVFVNPAPATNLKVTTPHDLRHAALLLDAGTPALEAANVRIGHGYDVHRLVPGRRLVIGGVSIPHETGLDGHSDADVLLHALCDALLGAAARGDIGALFPDTDPAYEGADSLDLCRRVAGVVREAGLEIANVDTTVIAQRPRLAPHVGAMRANIAAALGVAVDRVSVKATTTEHLGFEGREEGIAASAVALLT